MPCETQRVYQPVKKEDQDQIKSKKKIRQQAKKLGWQLKPGKGKDSFIATKPFSQDKILIDVLAGGTVKITVPGKISAANHMSAETFLRDIQFAMGAAVEIHHIHGGAAHTHGEHTHA